MGLFMLYTENLFGVHLKMHDVIISGTAWQTTKFTISINPLVSIYVTQSHCGMILQALIEKIVWGLKNAYTPGFI